jgi:hypothetical protein
MKQLNKLNLPTITVLCLLLLQPWMMASGQGLSYAEITQPDLSTFPTITTYLNAFDEQGSFLPNIAQNEITILENGVEYKPSKLTSLQTPLNIIVAFNSSFSLAIRDGAGVSRYDKVVAHLQNWADTLPATNHDSMALVWNGGIIGSKLSPYDWKNKVDGFDPLLNTSTSSLAALSYALDVAQDSPNSPGIKKAILLISGHLNNTDSAGLSDLLARAKQAKVHVFVLVTDAPNYYETAGVQELFKLANQTGGQYATFSGTETLPYPEKWFSPFRSVYELSYDTTLRQPEDVTFSVQINHSGYSLSSQLLKFTLDIQAPVVTLLSPPIEITRDNPKNRFDLQSFYPKEVRISALIEFPDKRLRTIRRTTLFVDGIRTAENLTEPFNAFTWNIEPLQVSDYHSLRIEVEDVYGLVSSSSEVPVRVVVAEPPGGIFGVLLGNNFAVSIIALLIVGGFGMRWLWKKRKASEPTEVEPVVPAKKSVPVEPPHHEPIVTVVRENEKKVLPWLSKQTVKLQAHLLPLKEDGAPSGGSILSLNNEMVRIGSDPKMANVVLNDRSISKLHARIVRNEEGAFVIFDERSLTGTWVNYSSVHESGKILVQDDIVNFGNLCYRFVQDQGKDEPSSTEG